MLHCLAQASWVSGHVLLAATGTGLQWDMPGSPRDLCQAVEPDPSLCGVLLSLPLPGVSPLGHLVPEPCPSCSRQDMAGSPETCAGQQEQECSVAGQGKPLHHAGTSHAGPEPGPCGRRALFLPPRFRSEAETVKGQGCAAGLEETEDPCGMGPLPVGPAPAEGGGAQARLGLLSPTSCPHALLCDSMGQSQPSWLEQRSTGGG